MRTKTIVLLFGSASLALINDLPFDEPAERAMAEIFAAQLVA